MHLGKCGFSQFEALAEWSFFAHSGSSKKLLKTIWPGHNDAAIDAIYLTAIAARPDREFLQANMVGMRIRHYQ
ncbi:hypothetical protein D3C73_1653150 [compost metagenome]